MKDTFKTVIIVLIVLVVLYVIYIVTYPDKGGLSVPINPNGIHPTKTAPIQTS